MALVACVDGTVGEGPIPYERPIDFQAAPGGIRRLNRRQYKASIEMIFGSEAAAKVVLPEDSKLHGLTTIGNADLAASAAQVSAYETAAQSVAEALSDPAIAKARLPCVPNGSSSDKDCYLEIAQKIGATCWRRSLSKDELSNLTNLATAAASSYGDPAKGTSYLISALLQAPDFLYLIELGETPSDQQAGRPLKPRELASRMSFFLLERAPEAALLKAADEGALATEEGIRTAAKNMLKLPEAQAALRSFHDEMYKLDALGSLYKNDETFPEFTSALASSMRESAHRFIEDIVWTRKSDARLLATDRHAFIDKHLAPIYGMKTPPPEGFSKQKLSDKQPRAGLLGLPATLSVFSHAATSSPTKRGVFIRSFMLCSYVPPPPPGVVPSLSNDDTMPKTKKELLEKHQDNDSCSGCHSLTDPPGYALEVFDAIGRYRKTADGATIDPAGESGGIGSFKDAVELGQLLHDNEQLTQCMVRKLFQHSVGHLVTSGEKAVVANVHETFAASGFRFDHLLVEIVASKAFQWVGEPK